MPHFSRTFLVLGLSLFVSASVCFAQQNARKVTEVGEVICDNTKGFLDYFSDELHKNPSATGYVVFYGGRGYRYFNGSKFIRLLPKRGEAEARVSWWKEYLVNTRNIDASRIEVVCGGYRERPIVEMWIVPSGATPPKPSPTLSERDIKFRRGIPRNIDMFGEDDCHAVKGGINTPCSTKVGTSRAAANAVVLIKFTGTVKSIEVLGERKLKVIPVHFDPRFAVTVDIESTTPQETWFKEGAEETFAIHSPAKLFLTREQDVIGKKYRFELIREKLTNGSRYSQLTASPVEKKGAREK